MASIPQVGSAIDQVLRKAASKKPPVKRSPEKVAKTPAGKPAMYKGRAGSTASAQKPARRPSKMKAKTAKSGGPKRAGRKTAVRKSAPPRRLTKRR